MTRNLKGGGWTFEEEWWAFDKNRYENEDVIAEQMLQKL